jgi:hypothetical protein
MAILKLIEKLSIKKDSFLSEQITSFNGLGYQLVPGYQFFPVINILIIVRVNYCGNLI